MKQYLFTYLPTQSYLANNPSYCSSAIRGSDHVRLPQCGQYCCLYMCICVGQLSHMEMCTNTVTLGFIDELLKYSKYSGNQPLLARWIYNFTSLQTIPYLGMVHGTINKSKLIQDCISYIFFLQSYHINTHIMHYVHGKLQMLLTTNAMSWRKQYVAVVSN